MYIKLIGLLGVVSRFTKSCVSRLTCSLVLQVHYSWLLGLHVEYAWLSGLHVLYVYVFIRSDY